MAQGQEQKSQDHWTTKTERMMQEQALVLGLLLEEANKLLSSTAESTRSIFAQFKTIEELFTSIALHFKLNGAGIESMLRVQKQIATSSLVSPVSCEIFSVMDSSVKLQLTIQRRASHGLEPSTVVLAFSLLLPEGKKQKFSEMTNVLIGAVKVANSKDANILIPWRSVERERTNSPIPASI